MKKKIAISLLVVLCMSIVLTLLWKLWRIQQEDMIPHAYGSVISALYRYSEQHHTAPVLLEELIPEFLPSLPERIGTETIVYSQMADNTHWTFAVTTTIGTDHWIYFKSSQRHARPLESGEEIRRIHTWRIFEATP